MTPTSPPRASTVAHAVVPTEQGALPLTCARAGGTGAAVVIMPSAAGIGPDLEAQMEELATDASVVVAFDPFFRDDPGLAPYVDMARIMGRLKALDRARTYRDLRAAIDWARGQAPGLPVVVLGICFGGPFALQAAADGAVDAVVTWHGSRMENHLERVAEMRCPMHHHVGAVDPVVPPAALESIRAAFAGRPDVRIVVHEGATHGFSQRAAPQAYDARAEQAGMASVRELVAAHAAPRPL